MLFRYRWFVNKLAEFERAGAAKIFPTSWEMGRNLAKEFCILTKYLLLYIIYFNCYIL